MSIQTRQFTALLVKCSLFVAVIMLFQGCQGTQDQGTGYNHEALANNFLDAFYAFDADKLGEILRHAGDSREGILSYQGWAEGGNYRVVARRPFIAVNDSTLICPVTVKDDLIGALELDMHVTDSFHLVFQDEHIAAVNTSSNDPPLFYEARRWVRENRPDLTAIPCGEKGNGGSPGDCVRAVVAGFREFMQTKN